MRATQGAGAVIVALGLLVASCGLAPAAQPSTADRMDQTESAFGSVEGLGGNCEGEDFERFNAAYYFGDVDYVDRIPSETVGITVRNGPRIDEEVDVSAWLASADRVTAQSHGTPITVERLLLGPDMVADAERMPGNLPVLVAVAASYRPDEAWVRLMVIVDPGSGNLQFIGNCAARFYGAPLAAYRDEVHPNQRLDDLFLSIVGDEGVWADFNDWDLGEGPHGPLSFDELSPQERHIDIETTPPDILKALQPYAIEIELPPSWAEIENAAICTLVPSGWNECVALQAMDDTDPLVLGGFGDPGKVVEIWLVDYVGLGTDAPIGLIGELELQETEADTTAVRARVQGSSVVSLEDLGVDVAEGKIQLILLPRK